MISPIRLSELIRRVNLRGLVRRRQIEAHEQNRKTGIMDQQAIWSGEQIDAWKEIIEAVHEKKSYIFLQLWAFGRATDPDVLHSEDPSYPYISASDIPMLSGTPSQAQNTPRPLTLEEIKEYMEYYVTAAKNAVHKAGFDGVEIHGANGYLIEQFPKESSKCRMKSYGGSPENRVRSALEVVNAVVGAVGPGKPGLRLSPWNTGFELKKAHPTLAYIHVVDPRVDGITDIENVGNHSNEFICEIWVEGTDNDGVSDERGYTGGAFG
ncbi:hypothetical protein V5O48_014779 [Marasmius crinis-equi]|uniref:NADH:flavin oxidoreductase/NADH oxidase N-terminal domain-containing protein n=1 Tax=Marasmius crinis-equi TaxID=585013 RepID=A0ABR3EWC4_9AGAR